MSNWRLLLAAFRPLPPMTPRNSFNIYCCVSGISENYLTWTKISNGFYLQLLREVNKRTAALYFAICFLCFASVQDIISFLFFPNNCAVKTDTALMQWVLLFVQWYLPSSEEACLKPLIPDTSETSEQPHSHWFNFLLWMIGLKYSLELQINKVKLKIFCIV